MNLPLFVQTKNQILLYLENIEEELREILKVAVDEMKKDKKGFCIVSNLKKDYGFTLFWKLLDNPKVNFENLIN